jgi:sterol-4alpha-carboxylate 3-dehydrogenase (decarboxylating)
VQLGDNTNLFDWTYVDNVAHAHLLAADKLHAEPYAMDELVHEHIAARILSPEERKLERAVPTSEKRPSPPGVPDFAADLPKQELERKLEPGEMAGTDIRPVARSKWDQFFYLVHPTVQNADNPAPQTWDFAADEEGAGAALEVAGQAFHITNGQVSAGVSLSSTMS